MSMPSDQGDSNASTSQIGSFERTGTRPQTQGNWWPWWPLTAVCLIELLLLGDIGLVTVAALPVIQQDLNAPLSDLQWISGVYSLTLASFLLTAGTLADRLGRKRVLVVGIVVFLASQVANSVAPSTMVLIVSRLVEGIAAAAMFAVSLAILSETYRQRRSRGIAFGVWGAMATGSIAFGPIAGGALVQTWGWRSVFLVQMPLTLLVLLMVIFRVLGAPQVHGRRVDWTGTALFSLALGALVFSLIRGPELGWGSQTVLWLWVASAVLLVAFVVVELRVEEPMLELTRFRVPAFTAAQIAAFTLSMAHFALVLYITLYLRRILELSALETGLCLLVMHGPAVVVAPFVGRLAGRVSPRWPIALGILTTGIGVLLLRQVDANSSWTAMTVGFVLAGIGAGLFNPMLGFMAMTVVSRQRAGMASGISYTFRQLGLATGIGLYGAVFASQIKASLGELLPVLPPAMLEKMSGAVAAGGIEPMLRAVPPAQRAEFGSAANTAFISGLDSLFLIAGVIGIVSAVVVLVLARGRVGVDGADEPGGQRVPAVR